MTALALTARQRQVAELKAQGLTNQAIAARLKIRVRRVYDLLAAIERKTGARPGRTSSAEAPIARSTAIEAPIAVSPVADPAAERQVARGEAFWRARARDLDKENDALAHLLRELSGLVAQPVRPPQWLAEASARESRSIVIAHTSDVHMGEVIRAGEIEGLNAYDAETCRERMRRYFAAAVTIPPRWLHDSTCDGVLLTMAGDLISGDIHEELSETNGLTSHEQVAAVVEVYVAGIRLLLDHYPAVHVVAVEGNHSRTTHKNRMKRAGALSYDTLAAAWVAREMRGDPRVTFSIGSGPDVRTPVYGRTILTTHGHKIGAGGGMGFAGPVLPIVRGTNKMRLQSLSAGMACDLMLTGHYHTSANPPGVLANGSVVGYGEFANAIRASVEPPQQWLARYSAAWGLCERLEVQLEPRPTRFREKLAPELAGFAA